MIVSAILRWRPCRSIAIDRSSLPRRSGRHVARPCARAEHHMQARPRRRRVALGVLLAEPSNGMRAGFPELRQCLVRSVHPALLGRALGVGVDALIDRARPETALPGRPLEAGVAQAPLFVLERRLIVVSARVGRSRWPCTIGPPDPCHGVLAFDWILAGGASSDSDYRGRLNLD